MINLALSLALGLALFGLAWLAVGTWLAGIVPFLLGATIAYFFLARRTGRQLEALVQRAGAEFQAGRLDRGRKILESGFALSRWQFLIAEQIHGQLGALDYMQGRWKAARKHLEQAWSRNWQAQAMLACIDAREKKWEPALERMEKARGPGGKDPVFWGLYAWMALESGDRDKALAALADGLKKNPESDALKAMADQVRNKKKVRTKVFAPTWYQFFPEHMPRSEAMRYAQQQRRGYQPPPPKGFGRPR